MRGKTVEIGKDLTWETDPITMVINNPMSGNRINNRLPFDVKFMEKYTEDIINGRHNSSSAFEYDYHERLFHYPDGIDQIEYTIEKLKKEHTSRRAIAITLDPNIDENKEDIPCLQLVQFLIRDGYLTMTVVFRSNDMLLAAGANMYALTCLQDYVRTRIGYPSLKNGTYTHVALVPHIYYKRDANYLMSGYREFIPYNKISSM
jgi:thymidylate synthase